MPSSGDSMVDILSYVTLCLMATVLYVHVYIYMSMSRNLSCNTLSLHVYIHVDVHVHVVMRDEKEGRKKQARSNKQQGKPIQHTQCSHFKCNPLHWTQVLSSHLAGLLSLLSWRIGLESPGTDSTLYICMLMFSLTLFLGLL